MVVRGRVLPFLFLVFVGCAPAAVPRPRPAISGSTLFVNVRPTNTPPLLGAYDFDLLGPGAGEACATRGSATLYWVGMNDLSRLSSDELTRQAIAAAALDAISRLDKADTILLTRVVTMARGPDRICATVTGRGIHLKKAETPQQPESGASCPQPRSNSAPDKGDDSGSDHSGLVDPGSGSTR